MNVILVVGYGIVLWCEGYSRIFFLDINSHKHILNLHECTVLPRGRYSFAVWPFFLQVFKKNDGHVTAQTEI